MRIKANVGYTIVLILKSKNRVSWNLVGVVQLSIFLSSLTLTVVFHSSLSPLLDLRILSFNVWGMPENVGTQDKEVKHVNLRNCTALSSNG